MPALYGGSLPHLEENRDLYKSMKNVYSKGQYWY